MFDRFLFDVGPLKKALEVKPTIKISPSPGIVDCKSLVKSWSLVISPHSLNGRLGPPGNPVECCHGMSWLRLHCFQVVPAGRGDFICLP